MPKNIAFLLVELKMIHNNSELNDIINLSMLAFEKSGYRSNAKIMHVLYRVMGQRLCELLLTSPSQKEVIDAILAKDCIVEFCQTHLV